MNLTDRYIWDETAGRKLADFSTNGKKDNADREAIYKKEQKNRIKIRDLQKRLYADQREGLIVIIVGMEASGKDRIIRKLVGALDPQGISVERYIRPEKKDIKHDMLRRVHMNVPERGEIAILSGTYYEDMLWYAVKGEAVPIRVASRIDKKIAYESHFKYARDFEEYLYGSSYRVVKIYLNLSLKKQKKRLLKRFGNPEQNWSLGPEVLDDRMKWFEYQKMIEKIIKATATEHSPWYVIPADRKWYANYLVSEVILKVMEEMDPHFPPVAAEEGFSAYREALLSGKFDRKAILQRSKKKEEARNAVEGIPEEDSTEKDFKELLSEPEVRDAEDPVNAERSGNEEPSEKAENSGNEESLENTENFGNEEDPGTAEDPVNGEVPVNAEDFAKDEASLNPEIPGDAEDTGKAPETEAVIADTSNVEETAAAPVTEIEETAQAPDTEVEEAADTPDPDAAENGKAPDTETAEAAEVPDPETDEKAAAPDTEAAETADVPGTAEETAPAAPAETETVAETGEEPPEKPAARRRRTRKPAAEKESPEVESSASKAAGSVKKARSGKEKEASTETPKRRPARKDGPPKTVGETLARRARKRGGS